MTEACSFQKSITISCTPTPQPSQHHNPHNTTTLTTPQPSQHHNPHNTTQPPDTTTLTTSQPPNTTTSVHVCMESSVTFHGITRLSKSAQGFSGVLQPGIWVDFQLLCCLSQMNIRKILVVLNFYSLSCRHKVARKSTCAYSVYRSIELTQRSII